MDLRKLEIFARVAELGNFSKAAESLHMAQPAVSIAVRKLEQSLETPLFDRSGRQIKVTAEGRVLLEKALRILREVDDLSHSAGSMKDLMSGELTIACPSMLATYFLPDLLSGFLTLHPGLKAAVTQAGTTRVEQMLRDDEIEIGITTSSASLEGDLEIIPLVSEQIVLCVANDHPWAGRRSIAIEELDQSPMVVYESGYFIRGKLDQLCAAKGVMPDFRMQTNFLPLIIKMVKEGLGSTVGLKIMGVEEHGICGIALKPRSEINMGLAKRRGRTISRANQAFLDWAANTLD
ncbi:MAG: LysR family transcriptional regulator [Halioglobus sp.]